MIVTGVILVLLGYFLGIGILYTVGAILLVVGLILAIAGGIGQQSEVGRIIGEPFRWEVTAGSPLRGAGIDVGAA